MTAWRVLTVAPFLAALALTFVRGAWISLVAALAVFAVFGRMRGAARVAVVVAAVGLLVPLGGALGATGQAFQDRVKTITDEEDVSSHERFLRIEAIVPAALENPLGHGLGQAGEASDLSLAPASGSEGDLRRHPDSTILSMVLQLGPAGAALVLGAVLWGFLASLRTAVRPGSELLDRVLPALLGFLIVSMLFGDVLYGLTGAVTWYLLGLTLARSSLAAGPASVPAERPRPVAAGRPASGNGRPRYPRPLPGGAAAR